MLDLEDLKSLESYFANHFDTVLFPVLAEHYRLRNDFRRAHKVLEIGLGHHPDFIPGLFVQAKTYLAEDDLESSEKILKRIVSLDPRHYEAMLILAEAQEKMGRTRSTLRRRYKQILEIHPGDERAKEWLDSPQKSPSKIRSAMDRMESTSVSPQMATFTLMAILKSQRLYEEALEVLTVMSQKQGVDTDRIAREKKELLELLKSEEE